MPSSNAKYAPIHQLDRVDSDEGTIYSPTDLSSTPVTLAKFERRLSKLKPPFHRWEWVTRGTLLLLSTLFFALWTTSAGARKCTYVTKYSPANEAVEYIEHVKYKGGLYFTTPWRGDESGPPGPDIDAAWRHISTDVKPIRVTEKQLHNMGIEITPTTAKFPEEEGGGFIASLEVTHHLHCLDMLRKATYPEYYASFDPEFQVEHETLMNELGTCVELIRQAIMCYPDLNMVIYYWVHGFKFPFSDSNTIHRCKNFDKILDWAAERAVDVSHITNFRVGKTKDDVVEM